MRLVQFTLNYSARDGVGSIVHGIHDRALERGVDAIIISRYGSLPSLVDPDLLRLKDYASEAQKIETVFIYHYGLMDKETDQFFLSRPELNRIFYYHNVTPARFFLGWQPGTEKILNQTMEESLPKLLAQKWTVTGDSLFNLSELPRNPNLKFIKPVLPPLSLEQTSPSPVIAPRLLFVGRFVPNKRQDLLIVLSKVLRDRGIDIKMTLVGKPWGSYLKHLQLFRFLIGATPYLDIIEDAPADMLSSLYKNNPFFVVASEHEGFCIPVLEALRAGSIPVARPFGALTELLAGSPTLAPDQSEASFIETVAKTIQANNDPESFQKTWSLVDKLVSKNLSSHQSIDEFLDGIIENKMENNAKDYPRELRSPEKPSNQNGLDIHLSRRAKIAYGYFLLYQNLLRMKWPRRVIVRVERFLFWIYRLFSRPS